MAANKYEGMWIEPDGSVWTADFSGERIVKGKKTGQKATGKFTKGYQPTTFKPTKTKPQKTTSSGIPIPESVQKFESTYVPTPISPQTRADVASDRARVAAAALAGRASDPVPMTEAEYIAGSYVEPKPWTGAPGQAQVNPYRTEAQFGPHTGTYNPNIAGPTNEPLPLTDRQTWLKSVQDEQQRAYQNADMMRTLNPEIAQQMGIKPSTFNEYVTRNIDPRGARSVTDLAGRMLNIPDIPFQAASYALEESPYNFPTSLGGIRDLSPLGIGLFAADVLFPGGSEWKMAAELLDVGKLRTVAKAGNMYVAGTGLNNALDSLEAARATGKVKPSHITRVLNNVDYVQRVAKKTGNTKLVDEIDVWKTEFKASLPQPTSRQLPAGEPPRVAEPAPSALPDDLLPGRTPITPQPAPPLDAAKQPYTSLSEHLDNVSEIERHRLWKRNQNAIPTHLPRGRNLLDAIDDLEVARANGSITPEHVARVMEEIEFTQNHAKNMGDTELVSALEKWKSDLRKNILGIAPPPPSVLNLFERYMPPLDAAPSFNPNTIERDAANTTFYHGTKADSLTGTEGLPMRSNQSLFGPGLYITDNPDVASSYAKNRKGTNVFKVGVTPQKTLNMDGPADPAVVEILIRHSPEEYNEDLLALANNPKAKMSEFYDALRESFADESADNMVPLSEYSNNWQSINDEVLGLGYDSYYYKGGARTKGKPHNVLVIPEATDPRVPVKSPITNTELINPPDAAREMPTDNRYLLSNAKPGSNMEIDAYGIGSKYEVPVTNEDFITVYRAVPLGVNKIQPGDYVTASRKYAEDHLANHTTGNIVENQALVSGGHIIETRIPKSELELQGANELVWKPATPTAVPVAGTPAIRPPDGFGAPPPPIDTSTHINAEPGVPPPGPFVPSANPPVGFKPQGFRMEAPTAKPGHEKNWFDIQREIKAAKTEALEGANIPEDLVMALWSKASILDKYDPTMKLSETYQKLKANFYIADKILAKGYMRRNPIDDTWTLDTSTSLKEALAPVLSKGARRRLPKQTFIDGKPYTPYQLTSHKLFFAHAEESWLAGHPGISPAVDAAIREKYPLFDKTLKDEHNGQGKGYSASIYKNYIGEQNDKIDIELKKNPVLGVAVNNTIRNIRNIDNFGLEYALDGGRISVKYANYLRKKYPLHIPLYRNMPNMENSETGRLFGKVFKVRKGSDLLTGDAIDNVILQHYAIVDEVEKNKFKLDALGVLKSLQGDTPSPESLRMLPPGIEAYERIGTAPVGQLGAGPEGIPMGEVPSINLGPEPPGPLAPRGPEALGQSVQPMEGVAPGGEYRKRAPDKKPETLITRVNPPAGYKPGDELPKGVFTVYDGGDLQFWHTDNPYLAHILRMEPEAMSKTVRALDTINQSWPIRYGFGVPSQMMKTAATTNIRFGAGTNPLKDQWTAWMNNHRLKWYALPVDAPRFIADAPFAFLDTWFGGPFHTLMAQQGKIGGSGYFENITGIPRSRVKEIMEEPTAWYRVKQGLSARQNLSNFLNVFEQFTRELHTRRDLNYDILARRGKPFSKTSLPLEDVERGGTLWNNVTANFSDKGEAATVIDTFSPFTPANIAGWRASSKAFRKNKANYLMKLGVVLGITGVYLIEKLNDADYMKATPEEISQSWDGGKTRTFDGKIRRRRLVKPRDWSGMASTLFELAVRDMYMQDPHTTDTKLRRFIQDMSDMTRQTFTFNIAPTISEPLQQALNKDFFFNQPMVSKYKMGLPTEFQTTPEMTAGYEDLANKLGISPSRLRHGARSVTGPYADYASTAYGKITGRGPDYTTASVQDFFDPTIKRTGLSSRPRDLFYDSYKELERQNNAFNAARRTGDYEKMREYMPARTAFRHVQRDYELYMRKIGQISAIKEGRRGTELSENGKGDEIERLQADMDRIAERALKKLKDAGWDYGTAK